MFDGFHDRGMHMGYLANMLVARATLRDLPCPALAFVAFAGPPISVQAPTMSRAYNIVPSPTIPGLQSFSLYRHARWAAHDTTGSDFTNMPIPDVTGAHLCQYTKYKPAL